MNDLTQIELREQIHELPVTESLEEELSKKREQLISALEKCNWNRAATARRLSMGPSTLMRMLERLEIQHPSGTWPDKNYWKRLANKKLEEKTVIEQKATIVLSKAILGQMADGRTAININMNMQNVGNIGNVDERMVPLGQTDFDLLSLVDSLPEPRLRSLIELVYDLAVRKFYQIDALHYRVKTSSWLGVNYRSVYRRKNILNRNEDGRE